MKRSLLLAIFLILFLPLNADSFYEIDAKRECDKWVHEGGTYLMWKKTGNKLMVVCKGNGK